VIIPIIIQTILLHPSGAVWTERPMTYQVEQGQIGLEAAVRR
jgi:hypothetical protein